MTPVLDTPWTAADRCDRCGAQAMSAPVSTRGRVAVLPAPPGEHLPKLRDLADIDDETSRLIETPAFTGPQGDCPAVLGAAATETASATVWVPGSSSFSASSVSSSPSSPV